jgi:hypothetical protein
LVDRVEVGEAGAFDQCKTIEDCVRLMLMDQTPSEALEPVAIIGAEIERQAGDRAEIVAEPTRLAPGAKLAQSLALFRPKYRRR